jgi:hypothetical protein
VIVNPGACNPSGIAHSIIEACREIREYEPKGSTADDPAIRLMVYQLASVCGVTDFALERYIADEAACKEPSRRRIEIPAHSSTNNRLRPLSSG